MGRLAADDAWLDLFEITRTALRLRREHPALRQRHWFEGRPAIVGGPKDLAWIHPDGREMTGDDWQDGGLRVIGMFVSGDPLALPRPPWRAAARHQLPALAERLGRATAR